MTWSGGEDLWETGLKPRLQVKFDFFRFGSCFRMCGLSHYDLNARAIRLQYEHHVHGLEATCMLIRKGCHTVCMEVNMDATHVRPCVLILKLLCNQNQWSIPVLLQHRIVFEKLTFVKLGQSLKKMQIFFFCHCMQWKHSLRYLIIRLMGALGALEVMTSCVCDERLQRDCNRF